MDIVAHGLGLGFFSLMAIWALMGLDDVRRILQDRLAAAGRQSRRSPLKIVT